MSETEQIAKVSETWSGSFCVQSAMGYMWRGDNYRARAVLGGLTGAELAAVSSAATQLGVVADDIARQRS